MKTVSFLISVSVFFSSCFQNFYSIQTITLLDAAQIDSLKNSNQRLVVHFSNDVKGLTNTAFHASEVSGELTEYQPLYTKEPKPNNIWENRYAYKKSEKALILSERHIYLNDKYSGQLSIKINHDNFIKSQVNVHDKRATTGSFICSSLLTVGMAFGIIALAESMSVNLE